MNEIELLDPAEIIQKLNELPNSYIFRGQASSDWRLQSSLERCLGKQWSAENAKKYEDYCLSRFQPKLHLYDGENIEPTSRLSWLALMQHYGAPTRLIDFTESPYVALYFAIETVDPKILEKNPDAKIAIFALNYTEMMEASIAYIKSKDNQFKETRHSISSKQDDIFEDIVDRFSYEIVWVTEPQRINKRLDRQSGCFLVTGDRSRRLEDLLQQPFYNRINLTKFTIPVSLLPNLYAMLRKINLNSKTLYGDLQGLCRAIRMEVQIYSM